jgi:hypothetical protein
MTPLYPSIALVIQGPVLSTGRIPKAVTKAHELVTHKDIVSYNSTDNIKALLAEARPLFGEVLCITWMNEDLSGLRNQFDNHEILTIDDPTSFIPGKNSLLPSNNKLRQFYSTYKGIEEIQKRNRNITHVIKIRTDQYLDLQRLCNEFAEIIKTFKSNNFIVTPGYVDFMISGLHDFYLGGEINELYFLLYGYCNRRFHYAYSVHTDLFAFCADRWLRKRYDINSFAFFLKDGIYTPHSCQQVLIATKMWNHHVRSFSEQIWQETIWRGYPINGLFSIKCSPAIDMQRNSVPRLEKSVWSLCAQVWDCLEYTNWNYFVKYKFYDSFLGRQLVSLLLALLIRIKSLLLELEYKYRKYSILLPSLVQKVLRAIP